MGEITHRHPATEKGNKAKHCLGNNPGSAGGDKDKEKCARETKKRPGMRTERVAVVKVLKERTLALHLDRAPALPQGPHVCPLTSRYWENPMSNL